jgi:hypothetical protein
MAKAKRKKKRGDAPDPEIVRQAHLAAGILAEIFSTPEQPITKQDLLDRPRPSGLLRQVRDVLFGVLHHRLEISQQKIAAALGRDRGVVSEAAHAIQEASAGDIGVRLALNEITEQIVALMDQADAWREAMAQENLTAAIAAAKAEREHEAQVLATVDAAIAEEEEAEDADEVRIRCHQCRGEGRARIHERGSDPAYAKLWHAAERIRPSTDGFHTLTCRFCDGAGTRPLKPATSANGLPGLS